MLTSTSKNTVASARLRSAIRSKLVAPDLLEELDNAASASAWWWWKRHLSEIADKNDETAFARITRVINGGVNGWTSRLAYWQRAKRVLEA
jgi:putative chitinase